MLCNPVSYYPNKVDEMTFFQDNNLEKIEIINHYNELISQGKYSEASDFINQQEGVYGFFADYLNLINKPPKKQPFTYYDEEVHFNMNELRVFNDLDEEEDTSDISLFSDDNEEESIENLYACTGEEAEPPDVDKDTIWI